MRIKIVSALVLLTSAIAVNAQTNLSFQLKRDTSPAYGGENIAQADFNRDGKPDMVYTGGTNYTDVTLRLGNGDGTFQGPSRIGIADSAQILDIVAADFDNDGIQDVAVLCIGGTFDVFFGIGDGTFAAPVSVATSASPRSIAVGDFNGDHLLDVVIGDIAGNIEIFNNVSSRSFILQNTIAIEANTDVISVGAGDFDHSGIQNIAAMTIGNPAGSGTYVLWNDGHENFRKAVLTPFTSPAGLTIADLNQDGMADILLSYSCGTQDTIKGNNSTCQGVIAFYGQGQQKLFERTLVMSDGVQASSRVLGVDVNGDGIGDLVAGNTTTGAQSGLFVWLGHPDGSYEQTPAQFIATTDSVGPPAAGDFNRDGMMDFVADMPGSAQTQIFLNATDRAPCSTSQIDPTVTVCAPVDNTYLPGPTVRVQANAYDTRQVTALQLYTNGTLTYSQPVSSFDQSFPLNNGANFLVVKAWDYTGLNFRSERHINVYSGTPEPVCPAALGTANMCLPSGATSGSTVHILANGYTPVVPTSAQLYIDGHLTMTDDGCIPNGGCVGGTSFIDAYVSMPAGSHDLVFKLWDANGNVYTAERNVTVQ
ncbi:FG-GAP-like repeat-containing protein [Terriglobus albidus]|uniref:FG-GAP-like repeat-containing protein n=1 Tax=Terriglobus albidus TaxID=1592106 RepID=UPI0021E0EA75|nr:FG-GAP-like repeat-containing protein [Terriglobus albidus]